MKKFISVSPFQPPKFLSAGIYKYVNNEKLIYEKEIKFPIIPVINGYAENGEEITLITVVSDYENSTVNYETLKCSVNEIAEEKNLKVNYEVISIPYDNRLEVQLEVFNKLISHISDNDKLFADITYGTKVMNQIITMGINYGYRICRDVIPGCIVYGEKDHNTNEMKIYDTTSLIYLDEIVRVMAENGVKDPAGSIKMMMNWSESDD